MQPFDYTFRAPNPTQAFAQSFQMGNQLAAQQAAVQQQQAAQQQAKRVQEAMARLSVNSTPQEYLAVMQEYPDVAQQLTGQYKTLDEAKRNALFATGERAYAMLQPGEDGAVNPDAAIAQIEESATAFENSNMPELAKQLRDVAKGVRINPGSAKVALGAVMAAADPDRMKKIGDARKSLTEGMVAEETADLDIRKAVADTSKAETEAQFAAPKAAADLEMKGWQVKRLEQQMGLDRERVNLEAMRTALASEGNSLKRQELGLKLAEREDAYAQKLRDRAAEVSKSRNAAGLVFDTANRILQKSVLINERTGKTEITDTLKSIAGPINSRFPTVNADSADLEALIETLGNQVTMSRIGEMKGVLSDKDMDILRNSVANLSLRQSERQLVDNVKTVVALTEKAQRVAKDQFGAPDAERRRFNPETGRIE